MKLTEETAKIIVAAGRLGRSAGIPMISTELLLCAMAAIPGKCSSILYYNRITAESLAKVLNVDLSVVDGTFTQAGVDEGIDSFNLECKDVISRATRASESLGDNLIVKPEHILFCIVNTDSSRAYMLLRSMKADLDSISVAAAKELGCTDAGSDQGSDPDNTEPEENILAKFGKNLIELAKEGKIDPVIGRHDEINSIIEILARRTKNNPCIVGDPGVGKTALAEGIALRIAEDDVPEALKGKIIYSINIGSLVSGARYRGDFEERLEKLLNEASSDPDIILFIDEIHTLVGAGGGDGASDAANIMKPMLARGTIRVIGATTPDEYAKYIEKDPALDRRFQKIIVSEPSVEDAIKIIKGVRSKFEDHHRIRIPDEAIEQAVKLSDRYIPDKHLPDKAIDLIDRAASRKSTGLDYEEKKRAFQKETHDLYAQIKDESTSSEDKKVLMDKWLNLKKKFEEFEAAHKTDDDGFTGEITADDIADVISAMTGVPVAKLSESDAERLRNLEDELRKRVIGQDEAVTAISKAIKRSRLGFKDPKRPSGSFIFVGTTGVGKTELAKALADVMYGGEKSLIRIDMSEYMEKHDVSKLIGAPPGYAGHDEGGQLTDKVRKQPYSVVLFDEIEKAHPDIFNLMLQILDDGRLTDSKGRLIDFKNTIIIMTSNTGARLMLNTPVRKTRIGFATGDAPSDDTGHDELYGGRNYDDARELVITELKKAFSPEFVNRVDEIIFFHMLGKNDLLKIVDIMTSNVAKRIKERGIEIRFTDRAKELLATEGYDPEYGVRPLRRVIQSRIEDNFAEALLEGTISEGRVALVDAPDGRITITDAGPADSN